MQRIGLIKHAKVLGFTLAEIRGLVDAWEADALSRAEKEKIFRDKIALADARIVELQASEAIPGVEASPAGDLRAPGPRRRSRPPPAPERSTGILRGPAVIRVAASQPYRHTKGAPGLAGPREALGSDPALPALQAAEAALMDGEDAFRRRPGGAGVEALAELLIGSTPAPATVGVLSAARRLQLGDHPDCRTAKFQPAETPLRVRRVQCGHHGVGDRGGAEITSDTTILSPAPGGEEPPLMTAAPFSAFAGNTGLT